MSGLDQELRDALAPLAGDPQDDAGRVLAALRNAAPPADSGRAARPRAAPDSGLRRWWLPLGSGAAAGLLIGLLAGGLWPDRPAPQSGPGGGPVVPPIGPGPFVPSAGMAIGHVTIVRGKAWLEWEPAAGSAEPTREPLELGTPIPEATLLVVPGAEGRIGPQSEPVVIARLDGGRSLRIRGGSRLMLDGPATVNLLAGEIALVPEKEDRRRMAIETMEGTVECEGNGVQVLALEEEVRILGLTGPARFIDFAGTAHEVPEGRIVTARPGEVTAPEAPDLLWDSVAWQAHALALSQQTWPEALQYAVGLVTEFGSGADPQQVRSRIARAGDLGEMALLEVLLMRDEFDKDVVGKAAQLLPDLATYYSVPVLLSLLTEDSADLRGRSFAAIRRLTGKDVDTDAKFWREASPAARYDALLKLRQALGRY